MTIYITDHVIAATDRVTRVRVVSAADVNARIPDHQVKVTLVRDDIRMMIPDEVRMSRAGDLDDTVDIHLEPEDIVIEVYVTRSGNKNTLGYVQIDPDTAHIELP